MAGSRRILANIRMPNGHIAEIQVRHIGMEAAYKKTESIYRNARAAKAGIEVRHSTLVESGYPDTLVNSILLCAHKKLNHLLGLRTDIHEKAAKRHDLDILRLDRNFHLVSGVPVMQVHDKLYDEYTAVVPDPVTGKYVVDNSFLPLIANRAEHEVTSVDQKGFIKASVNLVSDDRIKMQLRVA